MTPARLLSVALLLCCLPALSQNQPAQSTVVSAHRSLDLTRLDQVHPDHLKTNQSVSPSKLPDRSIVIAPGIDGRLGADTTCLKIRSYVVARDSKDSDSTHPVSYSTCQPAARYQLKTTEIQPRKLFHTPE